MAKRDIRILIVDNYDSYTYNLLQALAEETLLKPIVIQNDDYLSFESFSCSDFDCVILSPGPGRPENSKDFGLCFQILKEWSLPLLGVCLGFQGLVWTFGGEIEHAPDVWHGRLSRIKHQGVDIFASLPEVFSVRIIYLWLANIRKDLFLEYNFTLNRFVQSMASSQENFLQPRLSSKSTYTAQIKQKFRVVSKLLKTPLNELDISTLFRKIYGNSNVPCFWLDSSLSTECGEQYSYMGDCSGPFSAYFEYNVEHQAVEQYSCGDDASLKFTNVFKCNIFDFLQMKLNERVVDAACIPLYEFCGGFVGYFGYETKKDCCPIRNRHKSSLPDAAFMFCDRFIVINHRSNTVEAVCLEDMVADNSVTSRQWFQYIELQVKDVAENQETLLVNEQNDAIEFPKFRWEIPEQEYIEKIKRCKTFIYEGETYEICLTNRIHFEGRVDPFAVYCNLRKINPAPYSCFLRLKSLSVCCSSPERFIHVNRNMVIESKPIKGTIKRGCTHEEDIDLKKKLESSEKDFSENLMIVDLVRNDFGRVCHPGNVWVPSLMNIESYATVHQLVSTVRGILDEETPLLEALRATFPMGSMTGAPKVRTMEIIDQLETSARGVYSGSIGYLSLNGAINLNVVIRTMVITQKRVTIGTGGAITSRSIETEEYQEILLKASALLTSISLSLGCHGRFDLS
ncbi:Para-aminobenzoate synthase [Galdieria sulphuraria]|nr:Para-aminobenzoate synthase [Galdieria sulphuraria]